MRQKKRGGGSIDDCVTKAQERGESGTKDEPAKKGAGKEGDGGIAVHSGLEEGILKMINEV